MVNIPVATVCVQKSQAAAIDALLRKVLGDDLFEKIKPREVAEGITTETLRHREDPAEKHLFNGRQDSPRQVGEGRVKLVPFSSRPPYRAVPPDAPIPGTLPQENKFVAKKRRSTPGRTCCTWSCSATASRTVTAFPTTVPAVRGLTTLPFTRR